jgi:hypothetical protein
MLIFIVFFNFLFGVVSIIALLLFEDSAEILMPIHDACRNHLTGHEQTLLYQAVICGVKYTPPNILDPLHRVGMGMILTSGGSHLLFLEICLRSVVNFFDEKGHFARPNRRLIFWITWVAVVFFALMNLLNPILVRVAIKMFLRDLNFALKLGWTRVQVVTAAGICALPFCSSRGAINGLLVGWIASLAVTGFYLPQRDTSLWHRPLFQIRVYLLLIPALIPFSIPHPFSIFAHILLFPVAGITLMFCSLSVALVPSVSPLIDSIISGLVLLLEKAGPFFPIGLSPQPLPLIFLVSYLIILTLWAWHLERSQACPFSFSL